MDDDVTVSYDALPLDLLPLALVLHARLRGRPGHRSHGDGLANQWC